MLCLAILATYHVWIGYYVIFNADAGSLLESCCCCCSSCFRWLIPVTEVTRTYDLKDIQAIEYSHLRDCLFCCSNEHSGILTIYTTTNTFTMDVEGKNTKATVERLRATLISKGIFAAPIMPPQQTMLSQLYTYPSLVTAAPVMNNNLPPLPNPASSAAPVAAAPPGAPPAASALAVQVPMAVTPPTASAAAAPIVSLDVAAAPDAATAAAASDTATATAAASDAAAASPSSAPSPKPQAAGPPVRMMKK